MICSTLSLLFHFIIFSVIWKLVWNSSLSEGPSTLLLTALIKPGRGKMQQCRLYTLQSLSCLSLIRLFWEQKLKLCFVGFISILLLLYSSTLSTLHNTPDSPFHESTLSAFTHIQPSTQTLHMQKRKWITGLSLPSHGCHSCTSPLFYTCTGSVRLATH